MSDITTLVGLPYLGEIGWEVFCWGPVLHKVCKDRGIIDCIVYGAKGKSFLYPFAEYREIDLPMVVSETYAARSLNDAKSKILNEVIQNIHMECEDEFDRFGTFWINNLQEAKKHSPLFLNEGLPYQIGSRYLPILDIKQDKAIKESNNGSIVFCVRDRDLGSYRNYPFDYWKELFNYCGDILEDFIIIGKINRTDEWGKVIENLPSNIKDLTNKTTIDECVNIFSIAKLVVGGSSGTMHLASRCGTPHLVWGKGSLYPRYDILNIYDADMRYIAESGWFPEPSTVFSSMSDMICED